MRGAIIQQLRIYRFLFGMYCQTEVENKFKFCKIHFSKNTNILLGLSLQIFSVTQ